MQSLCYYCMTPTMDGKVCRVCGKPAAVLSKGKDAGVLPLGTELNDGSVIVGAPIGRGGFGITYHALDKKSGKRIALKEFMPNHLAIRLADGKGIAVVAGNEDVYLSAKRGFIREANVLNKLRRHPNIVKVLFTIDENNTVYYGMEYLEGDNLAVWAKKKHPKSPMPVTEACALLAPIMDALIYCHSKPVLHRDLSPDNILICTDEHGKPIPKLIDFGAAYVAIQDFTHTFPNVRKAYFSPLEQMTGNSEDQGSWSDVYSLCATIYFLVTGKLPPSAIDILAGTERLRKPSELGIHMPEDAEKVLMRGMEMDYKKRIQTMKEFRDQFCKSLNVDYPEHLVQTPEPGKDRHEPVKPETPKEEEKVLKEEPKKEDDPEPRQTRNTEPEDQTDRSEKKIFIRAVIYLALVFVCYGLGFYFAGLPGLIYGWLALSLVLIISLLLTGSTPGMKAAGLRLVDGNGARNSGRMILYAFLNASPLGLVDGMLLLDGRDAICGKICGLKCVAIHPTEQNQDPIRPEESTVIGKTNQASESEPRPVSREPEPVPHSPVKRPSAMMKGISGPMHGRVLSVYDGDVLGRNPQRAQLLVSSEDGTVSRAHCRFVYAKSKGKWGIVNLSDNGIVVNGNSVSEKEGKPVVIPSGSEIRVGGSTYIFTANS